MAGFSLSGPGGTINCMIKRVRMYQDMANTLEDLDAITICAVDGMCVGEGLEVTMACDSVVATEQSKWGMPETDWGIVSGWGGTARMTRYIGRRKTKEINFLGALHSRQIRCRTRSVQSRRPKWGAGRGDREAVDLKSPMQKCTLLISQASKSLRVSLVNLTSCGQANSRGTAI